MGVKELDKHSVLKKISTGKRRLDGFRLTGQNNRFELGGTDKKNLNAVSLYLIKHRILIRMRFIDIKSLHVMYYLPFDRLMGL